VVFLTLTDGSTMGFQPTGSSRGPAGRPGDCPRCGRPFDNTSAARGPGIVALPATPALPAQRGAKGVVRLGRGRVWAAAPGFDARNRVAAPGITYLTPVSGVLEWLVGLAKNESIITDTRIKHTYDGFKDAFVHMRGLGFIENKIVGGGFSDLEKGDPGPRDARDYFVITKQGGEFLQHLERISGKTVGELVNS
jgi:hypothetical protein